MKIAATLLTLLVLSSPHTPAQDTTHLNLPEGAIACLSKGRFPEIQYLPDGTRLAVASTIGIWLYDTTTDRAIALLTGHTHRFVSVAFSPAGTTLASVSWDGTARLWDVQTGEQKQEFTGHTGWVESVAFSPEGATLASGSTDGTVLLWKVAD